MQKNITITNAALMRVNQLLSDKGNPDLMLRVYIKGGGCSGFQYGFQLNDHQQEDDVAIDFKGIKILIDMISFQYLVGSEIDYTDDLMGSRFFVNNPNATTTCGCGSSFSV